MGRFKDAAIQQRQDDEGCGCDELVVVAPAERGWDVTDCLVHGLVKAADWDFIRSTPKDGMA